jgi:hypothetical protein
MTHMTPRSERANRHSALDYELLALLASIVAPYRATLRLANWPGQE